MIHALASLVMIAVAGAVYGWGIPGLPYSDLGRLVCMGSLVLIAVSCVIYVVAWIIQGALKWSRTP